MEPVFPDRLGERAKTHAFCFPPTCFCPPNTYQNQECAKGGLEDGYPSSCWLGGEGRGRRDHDCVMCAPLDCLGEERTSPLRVEGAVKGPPTNGVPPVDKHI